MHRQLPVRYVRYEIHDGLPQHSATRVSAAMPAAAATRGS